MIVKEPRPCRLSSRQKRCTQHLPLLTAHGGEGFGVQGFWGSGGLRVDGFKGLDG